MDIFLQKATPPPQWHNVTPLPLFGWEKERRYPPPYIGTVERSCTGRATNSHISTSKSPLFAPFFRRTLFDVPRLAPSIPITHACPSFRPLNTACVQCCSAAVPTQQRILLFCHGQTGYFLCSSLDKSEIPMIPTYFFSRNTCLVRGCLSHFCTSPFSPPFRFATHEGRPTHPHFPIFSFPLSPGPSTSSRETRGEKE